MKVPAHRLLAACFALSAAPTFSQTPEAPAEAAPPAAEAPGNAAPVPSPAPPPVESAPPPPAAPAPTRSRPRPARPPAPHYDWVELDYRSRYGGSGDDRVRSESGIGVAFSALLAPYFYLTAAVSQDEFDQGFSFPPFELQVESTVQEWNVGLGGYIPVAPSTHLVANATYESATDDSDFRLTDTSNPANNTSGNIESEGDGFGFLLGVRTMLSAHSELAAHYKRTELDGDYSDSVDEFESSVDTFAALLTTQITPKLALVLRFERSGSDNTEHEDTDGDGRVDTTTEDRPHDEVYGLGLRFRF